LQPGAVGDTIRARDHTSHKIFRASVVSAGKLQALAN
jgi:flagella basal body P-ring formation protein FlgA